MRKSNVQNEDLDHLADRSCPLRLAVAAKLAFPDGSMTVSGLRKEAARGNLTIERIAGKDYTTLEYIGEMRKACRVQGNHPASVSERPARTSEAKSSPVVCGSSSTTDGISPRDALKAKMKKQTKRLPST